jgi:ATP-dependent helicase HrpB
MAETSVTLEGVSVVVDSGLARRAEFDLAAGVTHLVTQRASQAAAAQRAGRAARTGPGVAYRLWAAAAHAGRQAYDPPEMLTADLAPLALALAQWGVEDMGALPWLDPPPPPAFAAARERLARLGALDEAGRITPRGRQIAALPLAPWQAAMVLLGAEHGQEQEAAQLALLLQERGLGGRGEDLGDRLSRWKADRSARAEASRKLADRWAKAARSLVGTPVGGSAPPLGILLALALPDNLARRRDASGESWLSAGGRGYWLDPASPLATSEWLVIGDAQGSARGARITAAVPVTHAELTQWLTPRIEKRSFVRWNAETETAEAVCERRLAAILISRAYDPSAQQAQITRLLLDHFAKQGLSALPLSNASLALLERARYAAVDALSEAALKADADGWLGDIASGLRSLRELEPQVLHKALLNRLDYHQRQHLDRIAPAEYVSPAGAHHLIDYAADGGPAAEVRVQALFGLDVHPMVGSTPLLLRLTSPAGRPIQATSDLPGFWRGSWADVRREMKGRYPKHRWPEEPWAEAPSLKTKNAFAASSGPASNGPARRAP